MVGAERLSPRDRPLSLTPMGGRPAARPFTATTHRETHRLPCDTASHAPPLTTAPHVIGPVRSISLQSRKSGAARAAEGPPEECDNRSAEYHRPATATPVRHPLIDHLLNELLKLPVTSCDEQSDRRGYVIDSVDHSHLPLWVPSLRTVRGCQKRPIGAQRSS